MVRAGVFEDVDVAITWHPSCLNGVENGEFLANARINYSFTGRSAHASVAPELGRSALDAVELMNVGVNYLREHMPDHARIHYAYLDAGGGAPNVVPEKATVQQLIRSNQLHDLHALIARVDKVAEGAAMMTETAVQRRVVSGVSNVIGNRVLRETMQVQLDRLGGPVFDAEDHLFAEAIRESLTDANIAEPFVAMGIELDPELALANFVAPLAGR